MTMSWSYREASQPQRAPWPTEGGEGNVGCTAVSYRKGWAENFNMTTDPTSEILAFESKASSRFFSLPVVIAVIHAAAT